MIRSAMIISKYIILLYMRIMQYTIRCYTILRYCKKYIGVDMLGNVTMYCVAACCPLYIMQSTLFGMLQLYAKLMYVMDRIDIPYYEVFLTIMKLWQNIIFTCSEGVWRWMRGLKWENGIYGTVAILWDFI